MLQNAIDFLSQTIPQTDAAKTITVADGAIIVRSGAAVSVIGAPYQWATALIRFIGEDAFAAAVTRSDPSLFGKFGAVVLAGKDGKAHRLMKYGMSASFAANIKKPRRRLLIDVSEAQKIPPAHGRKSARVDNSATLEIAQ